MKGFYDKMLVKSANKFGKKYGAKVEVKGLGDAPGYDIGMATGDNSTRWFVNYQDAEKYGYHAAGGPFKTKAEAIAAAKDMPKLEDAGEQVWSMKLTPEMKKALAGGVALSGMGILGADQTGATSMNNALLGIK